MMTAPLYEGYEAVVIDTTPFWRPKLQRGVHKVTRQEIEQASNPFLSLIWCDLPAANGRSLLVNRPG